MPRRLLIIDEFQRPIDGDDATADRCVQLLDDLARTGRAAGFHLILASQTLSGIRGLAARSDAIFAQFHHRISLRNTPSELAAILAPHNTAAAELAHRGEVIMNSQLGDPTANRRAVVALADPASLVRLRRDLWMSAPPEAPPLIFRRSRPAAWTQQVRRLVAEGGPTLTPGAPISVREPALCHRIGRGGYQSIAVIGTDEELVGPTIAALATSLVLSTRGSWRIELIDGLGGRAPTVLAGRLAGLLTALGAGAVITAPANLAVRLAELARPGPATLVIGLGMDAVKGLEDPDPDTFASPLDDLRELVRSGSDHDRLLVGWWRARRAVDQQLGFDAPGLRAWSLCGVSRDDVEAVCGPLVRPPQGSPRTLWHDRGAAGEPRVLVPFAWPDPELLVQGSA